LALVTDPDDYYPVAPDLVAEVTSPDDRPGAIADKIAEWPSAGVRMVWQVYPASRTVVVHRPGAQGPVLPLAAGGPDRLLVLEMDLKDRELIVYRGGLIDTVGGRMTRRGLFRAPAPQVTAAWSPSAGGFLVIDEVAGKLLRIAPDAEKPEVALSPEPRQPRPSALAVHPALALVAVHLSDAMEGTSHLLTAESEGNALRRPMRAIMPEGVIRSLAWRPDGPLPAVLRQNGRKSYLTVMDRHGAIFADARLPDGWAGTSAAWSPDGSAVRTASANTLAVLRFG
jgi:hypothetical protein